MWSSDSLRNLILTLYMIFMPIEVWSASAVEITFGENNQVQGDHVLLGNVASIFTKSKIDFQALSKLEIAEFPQDQSSISMPSNYLRTRIAESIHLNAEDITIHGAEMLQFTKLVKASPEPAKSENSILAEIKRMAIDGKHVSDGVQLIIEPRSGFEKIQNFSLSDYSLEAVMEKQLWRGDMNFRLKAKTENAETSPWFAVSLRWYADAWTPSREIPFMAELRAESFVKARTDITALDGVVLAADEESLAKQIKGMRAKRTIRPSITLTSVMLDHRPDGMVGQALKIIFVGESGLRVATDGALIENATIGTMIKARLRKTKKIVVGTLVSPNTMEVQL